MDSGTALDRVDSGVVKVLDALGAAWVTYQLYPNPKDQLPFRRAVETINAEATGDVVGIGPGIFVVEGEEYVPRRDGVEKVARRLFLHDVENLRITGGSSVEGLAGFFEAVAEDDEAVREAGGIAAVLSGVLNIGVEARQRGLLNLAPGEGGVEGAVKSIEESIDELDLPELARFAFSGAGAEEIAAAAGTDEPDVAPVEAYIEAYRELHGKIVEGAEDPDGSLLHGLRLPTDDPYRTVRSYIESFFHLPRWMQINVLEEVLADPERAENQMFLDQFSGQDLTDLLPELHDGASDQLLDYAVEAASEEAGHPLDLLAGLSSATEVEEARKAVADRVSSVLADREHNADRLAGIRVVMEEPINEQNMERTTLRELLECEDRRERFQRVARVWTARIGRYIKDGDLERAAYLLDLAGGEAAYQGDNDDLIRKSLERLTTPELLRSLALDRSGEQGEAAGRLLTGLGRQVIDELVIQLASEEDRAMRRQLTELLAAAARNEPDAIEPYLPDQRWFVVRNLVTALGHTGNPDAANSVRLVVSHNDYRVRTEALRSMVTLLGDDASPLVIRALGDDSEHVRQTAAALLRGSSLGDVDRALADEIRADALPTDSAVAAVKILAARRGPHGRAVLEVLAGRRFAWRSRARTLRKVSAGVLRDQT